MAALIRRKLDDDSERDEIPSGTLYLGHTGTAEVVALNEKTNAVSRIPVGKIPCALSLPTLSFYGDVASIAENFRCNTSPAAPAACAQSNNLTSLST